MASGDLRGLLAQLEQVVGPVTPPKPRYRAGYSPPKKPKIDELWGRGTTLKNKHQRLLDRFDSDKLWLMMALVGMFEEDRLAQSQGLLIDSYQSTGLASDWNLVCAYLAALPFEPVKKTFRDDTRADARMIQDAVRYLRDEETARFAEAFGGDLAMEEARYLTIYGRIVSRAVINLDDPDFPYRMDLLDPATVFFKESGRGVDEAYHRYQTTYRELVGAFGEPKGSDLRKLKNDHGNEEWLDTDVEALDYWDSWWRAVVTQDATFVPVTAHEYGIVPVTRTFGPLGLPVSSQGNLETQAQTNGATWVSQSARHDHLAHQGLSYIHYMRREHSQFEAVMARMVTGFKKAINPPLLRERDIFAAEQDRHPLDTGPGAVNETMLGMEKVSPIPTVAAPIEVNTLLTALTQEQRGTRLPPMFGGFNEQSNVSGTAQNGLADAGMEKVNPWQRSTERYHSSRMGQFLGMWRNFGHLAAYGSGERRAFMIPRSRPAPGETPAFELTRDLIDRIGTRIEVRMSKPRSNQLLPIVNAYQGMVANGWATDAMAMEALGMTDTDRIREEWIEDKALKQALDHPKFVEGFTIPLALREAMKEAAGNPEAQAGFAAAIEWWFTNVVQPAQMQQQQQMMQPQGMPGQMPPGMPPGGPMPGQPMGMPQPGQMMGGQPGAPPIPNGQPLPAQLSGPDLDLTSTAGVSLPDATGQAPGSIAGMQGGQPPIMMPPGMMPGQRR